MLIDFRRTDI